MRKPHAKHLSAMSASMKAPAPSGTRYYPQVLASTGKILPHQVGAPYMVPLCTRREILRVRSMVSYSAAVLERTVPS